MAIEEREVIVETPVVVTPLKRVSWSAIFAGALVGVGLGFLLNLFGIAIGLSAYSVNNGATVVAVGGLIGILIGVIASMLAAGYTAGYLGRGYCPRRNLGILYGFTTWTVALILSAAVSAHISHHVVTYSNAITHTTVVAPDNTEGTPSATISNTEKPQSTQPQVNVQVTPEQLAWTSFTIFVLFFIGAFATCVGACWGMSCKRDD